MKENEITNNYEIHMCRGKELAAHMRCSYVNEDVVIKPKDRNNSKREEPRFCDSSR